MKEVTEVEGGPGEQLVAGRYRIDEKIASGGMGTVYRAYDRVLRRPLALKRLLVKGREDERLRMFEREYHTLAGLKHPRIIEVYDYGKDDGGPYYTMELLDGRDLKELAPLPFVTACRYLRDVASSLALLHSRGLLHRDLSPGNVRVTSDDRAKLIDFGALTVFGVHPEVVGTAPCIPPEALQSGALDRLADMYSLGALAYWVLTGRHAFAARFVNELPAAWRRDPRPPSEVMAETGYVGELIPAALDELVLSLLSRNPLARPSSAAEVIARLNAIATLEPDTEPLTARSYLLGGKTVGRARERAQLQARLKSAVAGKSSAVVIEAERGMGVNRLVRELGIEAKLAGATSITVDASLHRGTLAVAREIARGLLSALPEKAREDMGPHKGTLAQFLPGEIWRSSAPPGSRPRTRMGDPREVRLRTQTALVDWIDRLTRGQPVLIAVLGFEQADESSAALLASLAHEIGDHHLLLVAAYSPQEPCPIQPIIERLKEASHLIRLRGLDRNQVRELSESVFGKVQNIERLSEWLHRLTAGSPRGCLDLIDHLVETGVIRFIEGAWALPRQLDFAELPTDIEQAFAARIDRLSEPARRLARALSVHRGSVSLQRCLAVAELEKIDRPYQVLDELTANEVLFAAEDGYGLRHERLRESLLAGVSDEERRRLHAQLGELLMSDDPNDIQARLDAGWYLLHGGDERRGAELLAQAGMELSFDANEMPAAIPALRAALEAYRRQGRSRYELMQLLGPLSLSGFYSDRKILESYGEETTGIMQQVLGIGLARRLRPWLGRRLGIYIGLLVGGSRFVAREGLRGLASYLDSIAIYATVATALTSLGTITLDAKRARQYAVLMEPLSWLGPDSAGTISYRICEALAMLAEDRVAETAGRLRDILQRLDSERPIADMPEPVRQIALGGVLYALGSMEALREDEVALKLADRLDAMGWKIFELFSSQIRTAYHAVRGELDQAERYRQRVEMYAVQAGSSWQADIWAPCMMVLAYEYSGDVIGVKRIAGELDHLSREVPSLQHMAVLAHASYHRQRGDHAASREISYPLVQSAAPRSFIGWSAMMAGEVANLSRLGEGQKAVETGLRTIEMLDDEDRRVTTLAVPIYVELALAEAALGDLAGAEKRIDDFLEQMEGGGPATRGKLHEARSWIAIEAGDFATAKTHLEEMERWCRPTANPSLVARCERLRRKLAHHAPEEIESQLEEMLEQELLSVETVLTELRRCGNHQDRMNRALELLLEKTGAPSGYLFTHDRGELSMVSPLHGDEPPTEIVERLKDEIAGYLERSEQEARAAQRDGTTGDDSSGPTQVTGRDRHRTFLLVADRTDGPQVAAAAALAVGSRPLIAPSRSFLSALADGIEGL